MGPGMQGFCCRWLCIQRLKPESWGRRPCSVSLGRVTLQPAKERWPFVQWQVRFTAGSCEAGCLAGLSWLLLFEGQSWMVMAPGSPRQLKRAQCSTMESVLDLLIVMEILTRSCCSSLTCPRAVRGAGQDRTALLQSPGVLRGVMGCEADLPCSPI